uniref:Uracil-DNA glycosylase-like domain-containing protein n=1 Tax=Candidozyma auris TaxID=498019 RepID=A0A0L0NTT6_CANAR
MNPKDRLHSFKYQESSINTTASGIRKPKITKSKATVKRDEILRDLPPSIKSGLTVVFVGFNPGIESSKQQHHYAHFTNLFWKLFNESDLLRKVLARRDLNVADHKLLLLLYENEHSKCTATAANDNDLLDFGIGFTDLVLRCTKTAQELSTAEKLSNVPRLMREFQESEAPFIVFIGKGIWEIVVRSLKPGHKLTKTNFQWGKQDPSSPLIKAFHIMCQYSPSVYVFPNTSGLVALMKYPEKLSLWLSLVEAI